MEKLTEKDLAMFLGCEAVCENSNVVLVVINADSETVEDCRVGARHYSTIHWKSIDDIKLKLRPLSDMTEEEKIEVAKLALDDISGKNEYKIREEYVYVRRKGALIWLRVCFNCTQGVTVQQACVDGNSLHVSNQFLITKYLISKGFDVFGYIPAGLAIDVNTIKK